MAKIFFKPIEHSYIHGETWQHKSVQAAVLIITLASLNLHILTRFFSHRCSVTHRRSYLLLCWCEAVGHCGQHFKRGEKILPCAGVIAKENLIGLIDT